MTRLLYVVAAVWAVATLRAILDPTTHTGGTILAAVITLFFIILAISTSRKETRTHG